jgi:predicted DNA binding CopG/RHH family protein
MGEKMKKITLDSYEQEIEDSVSDYKPVYFAEKERIETIIDKVNKSKNINIRISENDLEQIKQKSATEGLPYQTLISSIIHKYVTNQLVDEKSILKSIQLLKAK